MTTPIATPAIPLLSNLSADVMHALGWALLHFLWQGTALAALAAGSMALCRRTSMRYVVGVAVLGLMLLTPVVTFLYLSQNSGVAETAKSFPLVIAVSPKARGSVVASGSMPAFPLDRSRDSLPWLVETWLFGVALFSLRFTGGFFLLERERRRQGSILPPRVLEICHTLQEQLGIRRMVRYCGCKWLQAPAVIGWFRPIVLLPLSALTGLSEEQLQLVIAHELAHVRRLDPFVNVFQIGVETLLFYHPAVWWLNKRVRAEREHCCDEVAVALCGNAVEYARALTVMEEWRTAPALAMAANRGPLTERIVRVLGLKTLSNGMRSLGLAGCGLALAAALVAGHALLGFAHPQAASAALFRQAQSQPENANPQAPAATPPAPKPSAGRNSNQTTAVSSSSYIDGMKAVGLNDLTVDQLIAMKVQDVTPEYVRGLQEQGLHPDAEKLIAMRVQGITPEYVHQLYASGLNPDVDRLIALKVQGADAEYDRGLKEAGINPDVDHLISMKVQGVTPEYVRELRAAGLFVTEDQVVSLRVQGVTPGYLREMHEQGIDPNANDAISMRVQDVTPEYVRDIHALGLTPSTSELISMRVQDVTPEYIKALQSAGFKLSVNEIIRAKVQDLTPDFIERARKHGFQKLTLDELIQLRQLGILDSKADI